MARLPQGEKERRLSKISRLLNRCRLGLTEQEVSEEMGWDRRTANNYLRELDQNEKAYRNGLALHLRRDRVPDRREPVSS
jgi:response regulator of citrate/malate metabolism